MFTRTTLVTIGVGVAAATVAGLTRQRLVTDLRAQLRRAEHTAAHDPLTGLLNREGLLAQLHQLLAADRPVWVWLADLDQFKQVNDTYGHDAGDQVIIEVARRMRTIARHGWQIGHLHGDEFAGCGPGDLDTGMSAAIAIRNAIGHRPFTLPGCPTLDVRVSIGVAAYRVGLNAPLLFKHADRAMYEAKDDTTKVVAHRPSGNDIDHIPARPALRDRDRPRHR
ncbi:diguanylate cyclase (GGDEF)-like protein [Hamadaea flava]|uniref:GGDEF domain-containing protein n=1 Tax=Hamadaea flava TaxID=1742688 RepID=A0ABV8LKA9_9ACTN|nr:GGDEF domain-containing protein [Hamadaea flava]MCP2323636.1 diguanylate cyclase (GGDEF)-like protein [Hamadaea flava]